MCKLIDNDHIEFSHPAKRRIATLTAGMDALRAQLDNETETLLHVVEERDALAAELAALEAERDSLRAQLCRRTEPDEVQP